MADQRLHAAQAGGVDGDAHALQERSPCGSAALQLDGQHAARHAASQDAAGKLVLRVARQARVADRRHARGALERLRHGQCIRRVALHAQRQRLQAAQGEERLPRRRVAAGVDDDLARRRYPLRGPDDDPADDVGVPADVLRGGVHDDIGTQRERRRQRRRGERVVHGHHDAAGVRKFRTAQPRRRSRWSGCRSSRATAVAFFGPIARRRPAPGRSCRPPESRCPIAIQHRLRDPDDPAVHRRRDDDLVAAARCDSMTRMDGRHARGGDDAGLRALELGDGQLERFVGRVRVARVRVPGPGELEQLAELGRIGDPESRWWRRSAR